MRSTAASTAALLATCALMQVHCAAAAYVDLQLEQSFGGDFSPAGTIKGDLDGQVCCWPVTELH